MQTSIDLKALGLPGLCGLIVLAACACYQTESFEAATAQHRGTLVDQVNTAGEGAPHFTVQTLNPTWDVSQPDTLVSIPALELIDQDGKARNQSLFFGKISFIGFFFATCHGFCPFLIEGMKAVENELATQTDAIQFVALSVNPSEDTPARLRAYANERDLATAKSWVLLTGEQEVIYALAKNTFASQVFKRPMQETNFVHSEHLYVIDGDGYLRGVLNGTRTDLRRDAKRLSELLLAERNRNSASLRRGTASR